MTFIKKWSLRTLLLLVFILVLLAASENSQGHGLAVLRSGQEYENKDE